MTVEMRYTTLGRTGLRVSRVALGAGGPSRLGTKRGASQSEIEAVVGAALDMGINLIDTARGYGTEEALGRALQALPGGGEALLATKANIRPETEAPERLRDEVEASLKALRRERLDLFQFHAVLPGDLEAVTERWLPVAEALRQEGKVGFVGLTEDPSKDTAQRAAAGAAASGRYDTLMVQYGIFDQAAHTRTFPPARERDVGLLCMSAARGALVDEAQLAGVLQGLDAGRPGDLRFLLDDGHTPDWPALAFRFAAACDELDVIVVGTGRAEHLQASARAVLAPPLPPEHVSWLRERFGATCGEQLWSG